MNESLLVFLDQINNNPYIVSTVAAILFLITEVLRARKRKYFDFKNYTQLNRKTIKKAKRIMEDKRINNAYFYAHMIWLAICWLIMMIFNPMIGFFIFILSNNFVDNVVTSLLLPKLMKD